jgi:hypothetical protein
MDCSGSRPLRFVVDLQATRCLYRNTSPHIVPVALSLQLAFSSSQLIFREIR